MTYRCMVGDVKCEQNQLRRFPLRLYICIATPLELSGWRLLAIVLEILYPLKMTPLLGYRDADRDREQGILDIVMHNVLIFELVNPPRLSSERRSCYSRLSSWLQTGSTQCDTLARKRQWCRYANQSTVEQNASIEYNRNEYAGKEN